MRIILLIILLMYGVTSTAQIYSESFTGQNGQGIIGPCTTDPASCDIDSIPAPTGWTITGDASQMLANSDWFVVTLERLEARDLGSELCFESGIIDICAYDLVDVSIDISEIGDHETNDYVDIYIVVDGDSIFTPAWIGTDSSHTIVGDYPDDGDWGDTTFIQTGFSGDTLRFVICVRNNSGTEIIRLDNFRVDDGDTTAPVVPAVFISELDCDQSGPDTTEFIELAGSPNQSLDSFVLVLFNGNGDVSYAAYDLDGYALDNGGFFTICFGSNASEYCALNVSGSLQNGTDGVGLYFSLDMADFPNGTLVQSAGLVDGLRYSTGNDGIDAGLSVLDTDVDCTGDACQVDENALGAQATHSIQRGSWFVGPPTPGLVNDNPLPVELVNFNVRLHRDEAIVTWETVWEVHNDYFSIEHSIDGRSFAQVGIRAGAHSSSALIRYEFRHTVRREGRHYYRLKQVDEDANFDYSPIRVVTFKDAQIFVTPTFTDNYVEITWSQNTLADIYIYSFQGILKYSELKTASGYRKISMQSMPSGLYVVVVESENQQESFKVLRY
jgi:hypothetical protein